MNCNHYNKRKVVLQQQAHPKSGNLNDGRKKKPFPRWGREKCEMNYHLRLRAASAFFFLFTLGFS